MFGVVPKTLWEKDMPPDPKNRIELALRCMLIEAQGRLVLVETGIGDKFDPKWKSIYEVKHEEHDVLRSLGRLGVSREDVTDVILTHLHFDHAGGATVMENGAMVPTFPRATHWVQRENLERARAPIEHDRASYHEENFEPLARAGILRTVEGERMLLPGITVSPVHGHAPGMQIVTVEGPQASVVFCTDLVPTTSHVRIPWNMAFDLNLSATIEEKKRLLARWTDQGTLLFFYHDPTFAGARVAREGDKFVLRDQIRM
jgi:glyoxylase-like metal-dependent hydrolase (beta-lactamase superfamily II)